MLHGCFHVYTLMGAIRRFRANVILKSLRAFKAQLFLGGWSVVVPAVTSLIVYRSVHRRVSRLRLIGWLSMPHTIIANSQPLSWRGTSYLSTSIILICRFQCDRTTVWRQLLQCKWYRKRSAHYFVDRRFQYIVRGVVVAPAPFKLVMNKKRQAYENTRV